MPQFIIMITYKWPVAIFGVYVMFTALATKARSPSLNLMIHNKLMVSSARLYLYVLNACIYTCVYSVLYSLD